jgi:hypothetical protein
MLKLIAATADQPVWEADSKIKIEPAWVNLDWATFLECYSHKN